MDTVEAHDQVPLKAAEDPDKLGTVPTAPEWEIFGRSRGVVLPQCDLWRAIRQRAVLRGDHPTCDPLLRGWYGDLRKFRSFGADSQPIAGLYAAGEVAGGVHGNKLTEIIFGRVAGQMCAGYKSDDKVRSTSGRIVGLSGKVEASKLAGGSYEEKMKSNLPAKKRKEGVHRVHRWRGREAHEGRRCLCRFAWPRAKCVEFPVPASRW